MTTCTLPARNRPRDESNDDDDAPPPAAPTSDARTTIEVVADKGYHKVELLLELRRAEYRTYIPVPDQKGQRRFTDKGGMLAREAFHDNRSARESKQGQEAAPTTRRTESNAPSPLRARRAPIAACDYADATTSASVIIAHLAALNLGLVMRTLFGHGTPRQTADAALAALSRRLQIAFRIALRNAVGFLRALPWHASPARDRRIVAAADLAA